MASTTNTFMILNVLPYEILEMILSKLEHISDISKMAGVSSFFSSNTKHSIILGAFKMRVGDYSNDWKTLAHIELAKRGIRLEARHCKKDIRHDIIVRRNDPLLKTFIGRSYTPQIKDISISRLHGALSLFNDYNLYKNKCIGRFLVFGYNGIVIEKFKKRYFYGKGRVVDIFEGDIIHLSDSTGYMYKVSYILN